MRLLLFFSFIFFLSCSDSNREFNCYENAEKVETLHGLDINLCVFFNNLDAAKKISASTGKPILTIFGCYTCVGYSAGIWEKIVDYNTHKLIKENYLVCYLYVDDKIMLKDTSYVILDYKQKPIKIIGDYNLNRQISRYNCNAQPFYSITNSQDKDLVEPLNFIATLKKNSFLNFIKQGLKSN